MTTAFHPTRRFHPATGKVICVADPAECRRANIGTSAADSGRSWHHYRSAEVDHGARNGIADRQMDKAISEYAPN
jgi:hypothetical protein